MAGGVKSNRIVEMDFLRNLSLLLLVVDHCFAIYSGIWSNPTESSIGLYYWIGRFSCSFMLPLWVFISGYLWGHQLKMKKTPSLKSIISKKGKRLLVPAIVLSVLYSLVMGEFNDGISARGLLLLLSGKGHLWFLPMLFWVFVFSYLFNRLSFLSEGKKMILCAILSIFCWNLPSLGIGSACYYLFFFETGVYAFNHGNEILNCLRKRNNFWGCVIAFALLFVVTTKLTDMLHTLPTDTILNRSVSQSLLHLNLLPCSVLGIAICFVIAFSIDYSERTIAFLGEIAACSFGIYLVHHYILEWMYFHSPYLHVVNAYIAPILSFILVSGMSFLIVRYLRQFKIGRLVLS